MNFYKYILIALIGFGVLSCSEDIFEQNNNSTLPSEDVFKSMSTANASLLGAYSTMGSPYFAGLYDPLVSDIMGEDIKLVEGSANYGRFVTPYQHNMLSSSSYAEGPWTVGYSVIYESNNIINNAFKIEDAEEEDIDALIADAKALRGYCLLQLSHMFCNAYSVDSLGLGLMLPTVVAELDDPDVSRSTLAETYAQILDDLHDAEKVMSSDSVVSINQSYINLCAVQGLLARTYLDMENWEMAKRYARKIIDAEIFSLYDGYYKGLEANNGYGFTTLNSETIFSFAYTEETSNVYMTRQSFFYPIYGYSSIRANRDFYNLFDEDDYRYYFFYDQNPNYIDEAYDEDEIIDEENVMILKYGHYESVGNGVHCLMRLSEIYLIEAEAQYELGHEDSARISLKLVQSNNNINASDASGEDLLDEILLERRKELFGEGFRLNDIKRRQETVTREGDHWSKYDLSPSDADYYKFTLPIPESEFDANDEIDSNDQNPGYNS